MSDQLQQENDARIALRARLPAADDEASQGETTSVETPEGRLHRLGERLSRRDRDRDSNLRQFPIPLSTSRSSFSQWRIEKSIRFF